MQFTCLLFVIVFHMVHITCLFSAFKKDKYKANQNSQILVRDMVSQDWVLLDRVVYLNMGLWG